MNTGIYRLIFNKRLGMHVPVAEVSAAHGKGDGAASSVAFTGARHASSPAPRLRLIAALLAAALGTSLAYANPANPTVVSGSASFNQSGNTLTVTNTPNAIINWGSFSIGQNELTRFVQQSSASAVLNRVTGQDPSHILGQLQSNGRVFIINPNGVLFGQGAKIDVAGLVASSLNISNEDFLAGKMRFIGNGTESAVKNAGDITTPSGGQIILIAPNVENTGIITSPNGEIILAAGHTVELADTLNPALRVEITAPEGEALNLGTLIAEGGKVGMYAGIVKQSGIVSATSAVSEGGRIYLKGSQSVTLSQGSVTEASGTKGGEIRVLADQQVNAHGTLAANGGGFIETSAATVNITGAKVSAGQDGTWLIDPTDVTIDAAAAASIVGSLDAGTDVIVQTTGTAGDGLGAGNITVSSALAKTAGGDATLTLSAHNNIAVNANITSTSGQLNLNLYADSDATGGGSSTISTSRTINANGGTTDITGGLTLGGGILANTTLTTATGAAVSSTGTSTLNNVTLDANLTVTSGATLTLLNGLTLDNSSVTLAGAGSYTYLNFAGTGNQQLTGTGEIVFGGTTSTTTSYKFVRASTAGGTLEIGPGITIHGTTSGTIGQTGFGLINHGTIDADTAGKTIDIFGDNWSSDGTLRATAGVLDLNGTYSSPNLGTWYESGTGSLRFYGTLDNSGTIAVDQ
jgi:filamentous hemagglutinin family protein